LVKLLQFESFGRVKCHILNFGGKSENGWILQGVKCNFPKKKKKIDMSIQEKGGEGFKLIISASFPHMKALFKDNPFES
jgi:hypothetical protein